MTKMRIATDESFEIKISEYPDHVRDKLQFLRELVIKTAEEIPDLEDLHETLKWGEPSFVTKNGSTLRMDWKKKTPDQYQMYFKCTSRLVETFKLKFGDFFEYEKNRAIIFQLDQKIPVAELRQCIKATLNYHIVKKDISLGI